MEFIDLTSYRCPYPLVQVKLLMKQMVKGDNLLVYLSDPGSRQDVPAFVKKMGFGIEIKEQTDLRLSLVISKN
ncbi:sulfurtransferase TusA family protein [Shewanella sp. WXL01]|uniref:Sulfurtransferase TusA family protein n=1 Tax=Shewanella maritima TaxID=2520507 RepID=A0A411PD58_9GAMM|nr:MULTISPECIES: sulfurtransferase TusA family protein [Shewanella]NKF50559.1 sulfurtransferase TusA family protein [Shewanella sp. WXL01]QBF81444.1 sulfurtransferase TusA family protein [Shewanella maritima]